jgi:hypothetical protein
VPSRRKQTLKFVAFLLVIAALGGGTWAWSSNSSNDNGAGEHTSAAAAPKNADTVAAEAAAQKVREDEAAARKVVLEQEEADAFCAGNRGRAALLDTHVEALVKKSCPQMIAKIDKKTDTAQRGNGSNSDDTSDGWMEPGTNLEGYCNARYEALVQGNGPGSNFDDYTDDDLAHAKAEYDAYCQGYEPPPYDFGG